LINKHQNLFSWHKSKGCNIDCKINLDELFETHHERKNFDAKWKDFIASTHYNQKVYSKKGNLLKYKSEQLIPAKKDKRPPLLLVFGNPATHSIVNEMFFSFEGDKKEHRFWKYILKPAGILDLPFDSNQSVTRLNKHRKEALFNLKYDSPFRIGLCVFITIPSAPGGKWGGISGIKKLIGAKAMRRLEVEESYRVIECAKKFLDPNGIAVVFQKNAWNALCSSTDPEYKLALAKNGKLKGRLKEMTNVPLLGVPPTRLSGPCSKILRQLIKKGDTRGRC
jgi:hypothetical protein